MGNKVIYLVIFYLNRVSKFQVSVAAFNIFLNLAIFYVHSFYFIVSRYSIMKMGKLFVANLVGIISLSSIS